MQCLDDVAHLLKNYYIPLRFHNNFGIIGEYVYTNIQLDNKRLHVY